MTRIFLSGQRTFGNRGCEAIVRSTVMLMREQIAGAEFIVPSSDPARDRKQWPEAENHGVRFIPAWQPAHARYWVQLQRLPVAQLKRAGWPFPPPRWMRQELEASDAVLAIGGDNYSLDYRLPSPVMGPDRWAMDMGRPVILWGASVGPFDNEPHFVSCIARHLGRMRLLAVRESLSETYVQQTLGLGHVIRMADPAFALVPEPSIDPVQMPSGSEGTLGFNLSPLLERYREGTTDIRVEAADFIRHTVRQRGMGVLLVPHVDSLGRADDGDRAYLGGLLDMVADLGDAVRLLPRGMNAAQSKAAIARLRFFIGARTHAAIAALSSGVPTISIAYSVKARGIHRDLLGDDDGTLPMNDFSRVSLCHALDVLACDEDPLRERLATRSVQARAQARRAAGRVAHAMTSGSLAS